MANWCINHIRIDGTEEIFAKLYTILELPKLGPKELNLKVLKKELKGVVSQEALTKFLNKFKETNPAEQPLSIEYGLLEDYDMYEYREIVGYRSLDLNMSTKWSPVRNFWKALSELTGTQIVLEFDEPGNEFKGRWVVRNGVVIDDYMLVRQYEVRATPEELDAYPIRP